MQTNHVFETKVDRKLSLYLKSIHLRKEMQPLITSNRIWAGIYTLPVSSLFREKYRQILYIRLFCHVKALASLESCHVTPSQQG